MRYLLTSLVAILGLTSNAQVHESEADSEIKNVTVFTTAAQINREAKVDLKAGYNRVQLGDLSPFINANSIQVSGFNGSTIVSVNHSLDHLSNKSSDPVFESLVSERNDLIFEREKIRIKKRNLNREKNLIFTNKTIKSHTSGLLVDDLMDMSEFYTSRLANINMTGIKLTEEEKKLTEKINMFNKQLLEKRTSNNKSRGVIEVTIKADRAISGKLEFNYVVRNAGWYPIYDLRSSELNSDIDFTYKAMVYQRTEKDWDDVKLKLSTGDPEKGSDPPTLSTWRLYKKTVSNYKQKNSYGYNQSQNQAAYEQVSFEEPVYYTNAELDQTLSDSSYVLSNSSVTQVYNEFQTNTFDWNGNAQTYVNGAIQQEQNYAPAAAYQADGMYNVTLEATGNKRGRISKSEIKRYTAADDVTMSETSVNTVFEIKAPYSIPTDGKQYNVEIQNFSVPALYQYYAAPRSESDAFLVAQAADWDELNILPGNSSIYFQGTFVGEAFINPLVTTDTLELSLGRDKNIVVERKLLKEFSKKSSIGSKRKQSKAYEITVKNNRSSAIELLIVDQVPISNSKEVEVEITEKSGAKYSETDGKLSWTVKLEPGAKQTFKFAFEVKYPKGYIISNL